MSRTAILLIAALMASYITPSFAKNYVGTITSSILHDGATITQEFTYELLEFHNYAGFSDTEWTFVDEDFLEPGVEEFILTDGNGSVIDLVSYNTHPGVNVAQFLSEKEPNFTGGITTVASNLGNDIISSQKSSAAERWQN